MEQYLPQIILLVIVVILSFIFNYFQTERHKERIGDYLRYKGATNIVISKVWFDFDKNTATYDVKYTDSKGSYRYNSCKIRTGLFSNGEIYWRNPP